MEIKLINCFSCVIPTINFHRLKILLVSLLFFIVKYIFLKQFVKLLMVKYTYLLIINRLLNFAPTKHLSDFLNVGKRQICSNLFKFPVVPNYHTESIDCWLCTLGLWSLDYML